MYTVCPDCYLPVACIRNNFKQKHHKSWKCYKGPVHKTPKSYRMEGRAHMDCPLCGKLDIKYPDAHISQVHPKCHKYIILTEGKTLWRQRNYMMTNGCCIITYLLILY